jgi:tRNA (mo5U34)-methyltransferase
VEGRTYPAVTLLPYLHLPADLSGKTVIDICTWDGYMAFECERRGARVTAVDSFAWDKQFAHLTPGLATGRDGFDLAHDALNSRVTPVHCDVFDLKPSELGTFDIVLFLGVLYHMRHPLLALEKVAALCDNLLILETHTDMNDIDVPAMRFYRDGELNDDETNWWGPNVACVEAMLRDVGFAQVESFVGCGDGRAVIHARRQA